MKKNKKTPYSYKFQKNCFEKKFQNLKDQQQFPDRNIYQFILKFLPIPRLKCCSRYKKNVLSFFPNTNMIDYLLNKSKQKRTTSSDFKHVDQPLPGRPRGRHPAGLRQLSTGTPTEPCGTV